MEDEVDTIEPQTISTTGYLVYEEEKYVLLAHSVADDNSQMCGLMAVPTCCILSRS